MLSKERIINALNHKEPDRIPVDFGGVWTTGISAVAYSNLIDYLGIEDKSVLVYDCGQQISMVDEEIIDRFNVDTCRLGADPVEWKHWVLPNSKKCLVPKYFNPHKEEDGSWVLYNGKGEPAFKMAVGSYHFDNVGTPMLANAESINDIRNTVYLPGLFSMEELARLKQKVQDLDKYKDRFIIGNVYTSIFEDTYNALGMTKTLESFLIDPDFVSYIMDSLLEYYLEKIDQFSNVVGDKISMMAISDDMAGQNGPLFSLNLYRQLLKPRHKILVEKIKSKGYYVFFHCCGSAVYFLPDLIDIGVDAINPVQVSADGMDLNKLKSEYGKDITFWGGGCDSQSVLPRGSVDEVTNEVKKNVDLLSGGGGYVFAPIHIIQGDVPPENIEAMYNALNSI